MVTAWNILVGQPMVLAPPQVFLHQHCHATESSKLGVGRIATEDSLVTPQGGTVFPGPNPYKIFFTKIMQKMAENWRFFLDIFQNHFTFFQPKMTLFGRGDQGPPHFSPPHYSHLRLGGIFHQNVPQSTRIFENGKQNHFRWVIISPGMGTAWSCSRGSSCLLFSCSNKRTIIFKVSVTFFLLSFVSLPSLSIDVAWSLLPIVCALNQCLLSKQSRTFIFQSEAFLFREKHKKFKPSFFCLMCGQWKNWIQRF